MKHPKRPPPLNAMIAAPSGSGKTYTVEEFAAYGASGGWSLQLMDMGYRVVDGDTIISNTIGWPKARYWWKDDAVKAEFNEAAYLMWREFLRRHEGTIVLYNPGRGRTLQLLATLAVIPTASAMDQRSQDRSWEKHCSQVYVSSPNHWLSCEVTQPHTYSELLAGRRAYIKELLGLNAYSPVPIFDTFEAAFGAFIENGGPLGPKFARSIFGPSFQHDHGPYFDLSASA